MKMPAPNYVEDLRGEIAELDRKIDGFHGKFDQKVDSLSESLHRFDLTLTVLNTKFETFAEHVVELTDQLKPLKEAGTELKGFREHVTKLFEAFDGRVAELTDRLRPLEQVGTEFEGFRKHVDNLIKGAWALFLAVFLSVIIVAYLTAGWITELHQHGNQIEKLDTSVARLDQSISNLNSSLRDHGKRLENLEGSIERIARLEDKLGELPKLTTSLENFIKEQRRESLLAGEVLYLRFPLIRVNSHSHEKRLTFQWKIPVDRADAIQLENGPITIVRLVEDGRTLQESAIPIGTTPRILGINEFRLPGFPPSSQMKINVDGKDLELMLGFTEVPRPDALKDLLNRGLEFEFLVSKRH